MRFELMTSSLPRKRSTPELHWRIKKKSGRRGSNPRPSAWKADALPTELLPQFILMFVDTKKVGRAGFEPTKACASRFTVCPSWPLWYLPIFINTFKKLVYILRADGGIRTPDQLITNQLLWPTELHRQNFKDPFKKIFFSFGIAKICVLILFTKYFCKILKTFFNNFSDILRIVLTLRQ